MKTAAACLAAVLWLAPGARADEPWTLEQALAYARNHSPDAQIARQRIAAAQAGLEQADAAFWPRLQFQSSYTRTDNPMLTFGSILNQRAYEPSLNFNNVPNVDDLNERGLVTVPLYAGGAGLAGSEAARADADAARQTLAAVRNELDFEVVSAFQDILKSRELVRAAEAAVQALETNCVVARRRLAAGTLLKSDVLDLEVSLAQVRDARVRARNATALAQLTLRNLLGLETGGFTVADSAPAASIPAEDDEADRPELAAAAAQSQAAQARLRGAQAGYQPRVSAFGSLDHDSGWVTGGNGSSYTAGLMLQWDLWDGFSTRAKARAARAELAAASEAERKWRLAINLQAERARLDLAAATENLAGAQTAVAQARESARLTRARFAEGLALPTQVMDAESALLGARARLAGAQSDQRVAIAALRQALALPQLDAGSTAPKNLP